MNCIKIEHKSSCSGCSACMSSCPSKAITMKQDSEGFFYPYIDEKLCINCGICKDVCSFNNYYHKNKTKLVYAVKNKDENIRRSSSSGGVFTELYKYVIENNGVVFGAVYDENFIVKHISASSEELCEKMKGSKYVASDLKNTFIEVRENLLNDKIVLFTGTPCQVSGLKSYLKNCDTSRLILCDIVCHGVPSSLMWSEYLKYIEEKYKCEIHNITFRDKSLGWHKTSVVLRKKNGDVILSEDHSKNEFSQLFFRHYILRPSCSQCYYTNFDRVSDITIGDYWGVENVFPEYDDNKGISLFLVNTDKGESIFNSIKNKFNYIQSDIESCKQPNLEAPSRLNPNKDKFWVDYYKHGFKYIVKKYLKSN